MLTNLEAAHVGDRLYTSDHDFFFWSSIFGEPFLEQEVLHYFDGETVTIVGFLLDVRTEMPQVQEMLDNVVLKWLRNSSVQAFNYFGPWKWKPDCLGQDFSLLYAQEPEPYNIDLFIDLSDPSVLKTRNAKESIRKSKRQGCVIWVGERPFLGYQHLDLIRNLALRELLQFSDVLYLTNITSILKSNVTTFFEAREDGKLLGFLVAHEFFPKKPFLVLACFEDSCRGISDALYATAIQYFVKRGASWLGLGYTIDEGILSYKMKWGGVRRNDPFYQFIWTKNGYSFPLDDYLSWIGRLLMLKSDDLHAKGALAR